MQRTGKIDPGLEQPSSGLALARCLMEGDPDAASPDRRSRRKAFGASLAIETSLLVLLVAAPLLTSVAQPQLHHVLPPQLTFFGAWREHNPAQHIATTTATRRPEIPNPFSQTPVSNMTMSTPHDEETSDASILDFPGGNILGAVQWTEGERTPSPIEPLHISQPAPQEKHPVKLSEGVLQAQLLSRIEPRYPPLALQMRQTGTVVLHAIISRDGRINALEVMSGSPFFVQAALEAVRQWRYRPTMLNGGPVEVDTTITVVFRLQP